MRRWGGEEDIIMFHYDPMEGVNVFFLNLDCGLLDLIETCDFLEWKAPEIIGTSGHSQQKKRAFLFRTQTTLGVPMTQLSRCVLLAHAFYTVEFGSLYLAWTSGDVSPDRPGRSHALLCCRMLCWNFLKTAS